MPKRLWIAMCLSWDCGRAPTAQRGGGQSQPIKALCCAVILGLPDRLVNPVHVDV
jgi:hypothetical protein